MKTETTIWQCRCEAGNCNHEWRTRSYQVPKVCPKCKSDKWDKSGVIQQHDAPAQLSAAQTPVEENKTAEQVTDDQQDWGA